MVLASLRQPDRPLPILLVPPSISQVEFVVEGPILILHPLQSPGRHISHLAMSIGDHLSVGVEYARAFLPIPLEVKPTEDIPLGQDPIWLGHREEIGGHFQ